VSDHSRFFFFYHIRYEYTQHISSAQPLPPGSYPNYSGNEETLGTITKPVYPTVGQIHRYR
jgi:hypothetical protein